VQKEKYVFQSGYLLISQVNIRPDDVFREASQMPSLVLLRRSRSFHLFSRNSHSDVLVCMSFFNAIRTALVSIYFQVASTGGERFVEAAIEIPFVVYIPLSPPAGVPLNDV
jgi:hypothetical protein